MSDPQSIEARRREARRTVVQITPEDRLERVADRLGQLAEEFPQAMAWVEAEVEAMRSQVRESLRAAGDRAAADREFLITQVRLLRASVAAMETALGQLRKDVATAVAVSPPAPDRSRAKSPGDAGSARTGLGLPPRRSASPFPEGSQQPPRRS